MIFPPTDKYIAGSLKFPTLIYLPLRIMLIGRETPNSYSILSLLYTSSFMESGDEKYAEL